MAFNQIMTIVDYICMQNVVWNLTQLFSSKAATNSTLQYQKNTAVTEMVRFTAAANVTAIVKNQKANKKMS